MFSSSYECSRQFPSLDLDMWDTGSCFSAQTSAWCGMAAGSGFQSTVSSTSGSFGYEEPGLRRRRSSEPEHAAPPFHPLGESLRAAWGESSVRQAEVMKWLQDAHGKVDAHLDQLKSRNRHLSYNKSSGRLLDVKHKLLSETRRALERQKGAVYLCQREKSPEHGELHEKVHKFDEDLLEMKAGKDWGSGRLPTEKIYGLHNKTSPVNQEDIVKLMQGKLNIETDMYRLKETLRETEERAGRQEEELNRTRQKLQASQETQMTLMNQIKEINGRQSRFVQNQSEAQERLSEANNKISQACLEKAILSAQVLKLEDNVKDLERELSKALADKDLLNENPPVPRIQQNEKLREELEMIKQSLEISQKQIKEFKEEKAMHEEQITDLEAQCSCLTREKEELLDEANKDGCKGTSELCSQHRNSVKLLESENQALRDQCLCLQDESREKEKMMHLQEEDYQNRDLERVRTIEELKVMMSHWTEKWQKAALTLQSKQEELDKYKKNNSDNEKNSDSLLRVELEACKQELQLERSRSQTLLLRYKARGDGERHTQDKQTETDLSESSLLWEPPSDCHQNKSSQLKTLFKKREENESELSEKKATSATSKDRSLSSRNVRAAVDRRSWLPDSCLMPVFEEDEENDEEEEGERAASANLTPQRQQMSPLTAETHDLKEKTLDMQQAVSFKRPIHSSYCLDDCELQRMKTPALYPDGIFRAQLVDLCSHDEEEEQTDEICC